jgi:hypothetical protein
MKKKVIDFLVLAVFWSAVYFGLRILFNKLDIRISYGLPGAILTLFCISFFYNKWWSRVTFKKKRNLLIFGFLTILLFGFNTYILSLSVRSFHFYRYITLENRRGWRGKVHQADKTFGLIPIPNAKGFETFPKGDDVPMAYGCSGFRIPLADTNKTIPESRIDLLFLGCSFTYGAACLAEETFPYLVAKETRLSYTNAGVCSYGLSQMLILAKKLIPKLKPKYVIAQYSPWLIRRGISPFAPVYFGSVPNPYFTDSGDSIKIIPPWYRTQIFDYDIRKIRTRSTLSILIFTVIPFILKEDWFELNWRTKFFFGIYQKPAKDSHKAEFFAYSKIIDIAKANNTKVILLNLYNDNGISNLKELIGRSDVFLADADSLLLDTLKKNKSNKVRNATNKFDSLIKVYGHYYINGKDSVYIDHHPNYLAHTIISQSIIQIIKKQ